MKSALLTALLMFTLPPAVAASDAWDFSAEHKDRCSSGGQQVTNRCLQLEYERVDDRLNKLYAQLQANLADASQLKRAQAAWIRFRDLSCEYENSGLASEGTLYPFAHAACLINLTEKRMRDLEAYLEWNCNGCPPRKGDSRLTPPSSGQPQATLEPAAHVER